jgi:hypothetical protein
MAAARRAPTPEPWLLFRRAWAEAVVRIRPAQAVALAMTQVVVPHLSMAAAAHLSKARSLTPCVPVTDSN